MDKETKELLRDILDNSITTYFPRIISSYYGGLEMFGIGKNKSNCMQ